MGKSGFPLPIEDFSFEGIEDCSGSGFSGGFEDNSEDISPVALEGPESVSREVPLQSHANSEEEVRADDQSAQESTSALINSILRRMQNSDAGICDKNRERCINVIESDDWMATFLFKRQLILSLIRGFGIDLRIGMPAAPSIPIYLSEKALRDGGMKLFEEGTYDFRDWLFDSSDGLGKGRALDKYELLCFEDIKSVSLVLDMTGSTGEERESFVVERLLISLLERLGSLTKLQAVFLIVDGKDDDKSEKRESLALDETKRYSGSDAAFHWKGVVEEALRAIGRGGPTDGNQAERDADKTDFFVTGFRLRNMESESELRSFARGWWSWFGDGVASNAADAIEECFGGLRRIGLVSEDGRQKTSVGFSRSSVSLLSLMLTLVRQGVAVSSSEDLLDASKDYMRPGDWEVLESLGKAVLGGLTIDNEQGPVWVDDKRVEISVNDMAAVFSSVKGTRLEAALSVHPLIPSIVSISYTESRGAFSVDLPMTELMLCVLSREVWRSGLKESCALPFLSDTLVKMAVKLSREEWSVVLREVLFMAHGSNDDYLAVNILDSIYSAISTGKVPRKSFLFTGRKQSMRDLATLSLSLPLSFEGRPPELWTEFFYDCMPCDDQARVLVPLVSSGLGNAVAMRLLLNTARNLSRSKIVGGETRDVRVSAAEWICVLLDPSTYQVSGSSCLGVERICSELTDGSEEAVIRAATRFDIVAWAADFSIDIGKILTPTELTLTLRDVPIWDRLIRVIKDGGTGCAAAMDALWPFLLGREYLTTLSDCRELADLAARHIDEEGLSGERGAASCRLLALLSLMEDYKPPRWLSASTYSRWVSQALDEGSQRDAFYALLTGLMSGIVSPGGYEDGMSQCGFGGFGTIEERMSGECAARINSGKISLSGTGLSRGWAQGVVDDGQSALRSGPSPLHVSSLNNAAYILEHGRLFFVEQNGALAEEMLLSCTKEEPVGLFPFINLFLHYARTDEDWSRAGAFFNSRIDSVDLSELDSARSFWGKLAVLGSPEGHLIVAILDELRPDCDVPATSAGDGSVVAAIAKILREKSHDSYGSSPAECKASIRVASRYYGVELLLERPCESRLRLALSS